MNALTSTLPSTLAVRVERIIAASPDVLFALWTEPAQLSKWWAPGGYEVSVEALEISRGGRWRTILRGSQGNVLAMSGAYRTVERPKRLAFSWAWEDANGKRGHETEVIVSFEAIPGGTRLVVEHRNFESEEIRNNHNSGWSNACDRLDRCVR